MKVNTLQVVLHEVPALITAATRYMKVDTFPLGAAVSGTVKYVSAYLLLGTMEW